MALAVVSFLTGDLRAIIVIFVMVVLGVVLRFFQEVRADHAAEKLKAIMSESSTHFIDIENINQKHSMICIQLLAQHLQRNGKFV